MTSTWNRTRPLVLRPKAARPPLPTGNIEAVAQSPASRTRFSQCQEHNGEPLRVITHLHERVTFFENALHFLDVAVDLGALLPDPINAHQALNQLLKSKCSELSETNSAIDVGYCQRIGYQLDYSSCAHRPSQRAVVPRSSAH